MTFILNFLKSLSVARIICLSFATAILSGSVLLYEIEGGRLSYIDSLYLAASSICVTGLSPVNLSELSFAGQVALMLLIQLGGLGILTFTVLIGILVIQGFSRNSELGQIVLEAIDTVEDGHTKTDIRSDATHVYRIIRAIFNISITIEGIGAIFLYNYLPENIPPNVSRVFLSIFTSVSAFNNAGFSILNDLSFIKRDIDSIYTISTLVILGGIGFPVIIFVEKILLDIMKKITGKFEVKLETHLMSKAIRGEDPSTIYLFLAKISSMTENRIGSYNKALRGESTKIQTNLLIISSLFLIFVGSVFIYLIEFNNPKTISGLDFAEKFANSVFVSVCARTAGFNTFDMGAILDPSIVLISALMFIGGGPQGTAGGIKITTFAILVVYLRNVIESKKRVEIFGETISKKSVAMSIRLYFLATTAIAGMILILSVLHKENHRIQMIFFEVISAFGTVGFSLGLTPLLSDVEKIIYSFIMYVGRIGIFTVLIALTGQPGTPGISDDDDGIKIQVG
ncbi:MAG: potassium transporter Trk [Leptospira sp.]|nr:potassium transporter Trk [Leptospira sp.]